MSQGDIIGSLEAVTGSSLGWNGDWMKYWDLLAVPTGTWDERMLKWINTILGTTYDEINGAMTAYAISRGATRFEAMSGL